MDTLKGLNVLVADDNKLNNQTLKQLLELSGASASIAENGLEVLEWLKTSQKPFHLILMDLHMPELDGLETTRIIRQDSLFSDIPIIALTGDRSPHDQWECFQAGMDAHIAKPLDYEKLCASISNVLGKEYRPTKPVNEIVDDSTELESKQEILRRFANNSELVKQMIVLYQREFQELVTKLDIEHVPFEPRETLHALMGLAGTIGAKGVVQKIVKLSDLVKSHMPHKSVLIDARYELLQAQDRCVRELKHMFDVHDSFGHVQQLQSTSFSFPEQEKLELVRLLQRSDLSAISYIEEVKNQHPNNGFVLKLSENINQLKFDQAIALLSTN